MIASGSMFLTVAVGRFVNEARRSLDKFKEELSTTTEVISGDKKAAAPRTEESEDELVKRGQPPTVAGLASPTHLILLLAIMLLLFGAKRPLERRGRGLPAGPPGA